jgi:hypothetical protein
MTIGEFIEFCEEENISMDAELGIDIDVDFLTSGYYLINDETISIIKKKKDFGQIVAFRIAEGCQRIIDKKSLKEIKEEE